MYLFTVERVIMMMNDEHSKFTWAVLCGSG
jgi:hypothetical protein